MIIVTTPMCEKILEFAGISEYKVNKNPDNEDGDLAILLSESKTKMNSLSIKLNTFSQIKESIIEVSKIKDTENGENISKNQISEEKINDIFTQYSIANIWISNEKKDFQEKNSKIKVKVYSKFLHDIVKDMGFSIIDGVEESSDFDYTVLPDYMNIDEINIYDNSNLSTNYFSSQNHEIIPIPTHKSVPRDPIKRAEIRYSILNDLKIKI
jgi:hypothetical protein